MAHGRTKSAVQERVATDDQIFKRLNKRINGIEKPINQTATIQTHPEAVKPDGTVAQNADDIRLAEGKPLRTPRGVLEYKETTEATNFPIKVSLETTKYEAASFYEAIDTEFQSMLQGYNLPPLEPPVITVTAGPQIVQEVVEVIDLPSEIDAGQNNFGDDDGEDLKTATEEFGEDFELKTEINAAGELTGVAGVIWMVWKGIKYRFYNNPTGTNEVEGTPVHTTVTTNGGAQNLSELGQVNPGPIFGLTNTISGRNLEVFLKDRDMSYTDIEITPKAEIEEFATISQLVNDESLWDSIEWNETSNDGFRTNANTVVFNDIEYEPGDIIEPSTQRAGGWRGFLPDLSDRWTEFHPFDTDKPVKRSQIYSPSGNENLSKQYEGELIRMWASGKDQGYFMVMEGEMHKLGGGVFREYALIKKKPFGVNYKGEGQWNEYHDKTYTAMDWDYFKEIGNGGPDNRPRLRELDGSERVVVYEHSDKQGRSWRLPIGRHAAAGTSYYGSGWSGGSITTARAGTYFRNNAISSMEIPAGLKVKLYDQPSSPLGGNRGDDWGMTEYDGPTTKDFRNNKKNDDISKIIISANGKSAGITSGAGWRDRTEVKRYMASGEFYKKEHLADYNKLFER
jgi:hypothetical protein